MADLALQLATDGTFDIGVLPGDLVAGDDLETSVIVSLFTDVRAPADIELQADADRRGYWGDAVNEDDQPLGSLLWTLQREKQTPETLLKARNYAQQALKWLISDGIARRVTVEAEYVAMGVLGMRIEIAKPNGTGANYRYAYNWAAQAAKRI